MGCSTEQTLINAQKSTGPKTPEGKDIVSRNGIKHGLLSNKPPVLQTEEGQAFIQLLDSLVDEWQPQTATERLCVEQIAMARLRLHRLWATEAAAANHAILKAMQRPLTESEHPQDAILKAVSPQTKRELLSAELSAIDGFIHRLNTGLNSASELSVNEDTIAWFKDLQLVVDSFSAQYPLGGDKSHPFWQVLPVFVETVRSSRKMTSEQITPFAEVVLTQARQYLTHLQAEEAAVIQREQAIIEAEVASLALPDVDRFSRYESRITHQLDQAIGRLEKLQNFRKTHATPATVDISDVQAN